MELANEEMLHIMSMDPGAYVGYSEYVNQWYVHLNLMEGDEWSSSSIPTHSNTPSGAIHVAFEYLKGIQTSKDKPAARIIRDRATSDGENTYFRWNGVCFANVPGPLRLAQSNA
jgi:hypothetical protein